MPDGADLSFVAEPLPKQASRREGASVCELRKLDGDDVEVLEVALDVAQVLLPRDHDTEAPVAGEERVAVGAKTLERDEDVTLRRRVLVVRQPPVRVLDDLALLDDLDLLDLLLALAAFLRPHRLPP